MIVYRQRSFSHPAILDIVPVVSHTADVPAVVIAVDDSRDVAFAEAVSHERELKFCNSDFCDFKNQRTYENHNETDTKVERRHVCFLSFAGVSLSRLRKFN